MYGNTQMAIMPQFPFLWICVIRSTSRTKGDIFLKSQLITRIVRGHVVSREVTSGSGNKQNFRDPSVMLHHTQ